MRERDLNSTKSTLTSGIIMCWERIDKREGSEQGRVYWDQKWYEHTVQRVSTESRKVYWGKCSQTEWKAIYDGDAVSQLHIRLLHQALTPCLDLFFCLGAVHNTLISTSSISTDLDTQEFFGFLPICLASCSCMSLRSLLSLSLRHSSLTMFSAELKEKSGSTILRTQRSSALITCYSTLTKVFLNWSSADPWFSSLCCPPTFCPPLLFSTLTISETTRIEMSL